jgi:hypothetical protein
MLIRLEKIYGIFKLFKMNNIKREQIRKVLEKNLFCIASEEKRFEIKEELEKICGIDLDDKTSAESLDNNHIIFFGENSDKNESIQFDLKNEEITCTFKCFK